MKKRVMLRVYYCGHLDPGTIAQGNGMKGEGPGEAWFKKNPVRRKIKDQCTLSEAHPEEKVWRGVLCGAAPAWTSSGAG